jgi:outer membrane protein OmpA-like peptidoglycan-associated protein
LAELLLAGAVESKAAAEAGDGDEELGLVCGEALRELQERARGGLVVTRRRQLAEVNDAAELTGESRAKLPQVLRIIRERAPVDISVVGHTDTVGDKSYNYQLSFKRAQAVAALLSSEGVDPSILDIASHGKDNPLIPTGDQVPEPRNRRVEVTVR